MAYLRFSGVDVESPGFEETHVAAEANKDEDLAFQPSLQPARHAKTYANPGAFARRPSIILQENCIIAGSFSLLCRSLIAEPPLLVLLPALSLVIERQEPSFASLFGLGRQ